MRLSLYVTVLASALSVGLGITVLIQNNANHRLQEDIQAQQRQLQKQQADLDRLAEGPPYGSVLREMAIRSIHNEKIRAVLAANGYTVQPAKPASDSSSPASPNAPNTSEGPDSSR